MSKHGAKLTNGDFSSYIGSKTEEKVSRPKMEIMQDSDQAKSIQQLCLIRSWLEMTKSTHLVKFVDLLLKEKQMEVPENFLQYEITDFATEVSGDNIIHRFRSVLEKKAALSNFLLTVGTNFSFSTNNMEDITKGGDDFTIFFQLLFLVSQTVLVNECVLSPIKYPVYIATFECKHCTQKIDNITFDIDRFQEPSMITLKEGFKVQIKEIYLHVDIDYLKVALSFTLGISFGKSADRQYHNRHTSSLAGTSVDNSSLSISLTDFRYVNLAQVIYGMILSSEILRGIFSESLSPNNVSVRSRALMEFCTAIISTRRTQELLYLLKLQCNEHGELTKPEKLSEIITQEIFDYCKETILTFINYSSTVILKTDTNSSIVSRFGYLNFISKSYKSIYTTFKILPKVETNSQYSSEHFDTVIRAKLIRYNPEWVEDFNKYRRMK